MFSDSLVSTDRQARSAQSALDEIDTALSSKAVLDQIVEGLPQIAVDGIRRSLTTERRILGEMIDSFEQAKCGNYDPMIKAAGQDPGALLITARIAKGLSQKDLARQLGLREQAVQRYEADRYKSITLANFQKFASVLGLRWNFDIEQTLKERFRLSFDVSQPEIRKVLKHARAHKWLDTASDSDEGAVGELVRRVADHALRYGTPSLLRTGLNVVDHSEDWSLLSWKAQVTRRAEQVVRDGLPPYRPLDLRWMLDLVRSSVLSDGPRRAVEMLKQHGIVLIIERQIPGMLVDGAAFLMDDTPVIGLTIKIDTIDNFWFSLLHELAHVTLHYRTGLASGFFDEFGGGVNVDDLEAEANSFAGNMLIPEEKWRTSPARISKTAAHIEAFARGLGIHPAIVFGRIRMERGDYSIFSNKIGRGTVRKQFYDSKG